MTEEAIRGLMERAGIVIDGSDPWDIRVHDRRWYARVANQRNLGMGESYMDGWWDCGRLDEMFFRLLRSGIEDEVRGNLVYRLRFLPEILFNLQSLARARIVARRHYDLGNDLFFSFLDPYRQYSCAYFRDTDDLDEAQRLKMDRICRKLDLSSSDRLLDIGCGWGGLARFAAERFGCEVTGVNVSKEQLRYAREFCRGLPVRFEDCDYRSHKGRYRKIVSVGMFEHVGRKNYRAFMEVVHRCLEDNGIFMLQTIGGNESFHRCNRWLTRYIFPNGMLPGASEIAKAAERLFVIESWDNLGPHYDRTLMAWNDNFQRNWPPPGSGYEERFKRMWEYYLLSSAGAFRARSIQLWQVVMTPSPPGP